MTEINFNDSCVLYEPQSTDDEYNREALTNPSTEACLFIQSTGRTRGDHRENVTGPGRLLFPADSTYLTDRGYRIEGYVALINPFGAAAARQYFRITNVSVNRDHLLENKVRHISCDLQKVNPSEVLAS